jgi:hypothetical protein
LSRSAVVGYTNKNTAQLEIQLIALLTSICKFVEEVYPPLVLGLSGSIHAL